MVNVAAVRYSKKAVENAQINKTEHTKDIDALMKRTVEDHCSKRETHSYFASKREPSC